MSQRFSPCRLFGKAITFSICPLSDDRFSRLVPAFIILLQNPLFGGSLGYCAPEEVYMKVYNHVRKISLQPVNTGHRALHILIRCIAGRCERISDDMRDRCGVPLTGRIGQFAAGFSRKACKYSRRIFSSSAVPISTVEAVIA